MSRQSKYQKAIELYQRDLLAAQRTVLSARAIGDQEHVIELDRRIDGLNGIILRNIRWQRELDNGLSPDDGDW